MALTDSCDIYAAIYDAGINRAIKQVMRQRPSLFNYSNLPKIRRTYPPLCCPIDVAPEVIRARNPLFTELKGLDILSMLGNMHYAVQLAKAEVDFHPENVFSLPAEMNPPLASQKMAMHLKMCAGVDCSKKRLPVTTSLTHIRKNETLTCFSMDLFGIAGATVRSPGDQTQLIDLTMDDIEIVDLKPDGLEEMIECIALRILNQNILPAAGAALSAEAFKVIDLPESIGHIQIAASTAVPNNPAIEDDQMKLFADIAQIDLNLTIPEGGGGSSSGGGGTVTRTVRNRTRTGRFDMTAAVSEKAFQKVYQAATTGFNFSKTGGGSFGPIMASYAVAMHLEGGSLTLNSNGKIKVSELDVKWDELKLNLGIDIPTWTVGGQCWTDPIFGVTVCLPSWTFFQGSPDFSIPIDLGGFIESEISLSVLLQEFYGVGSGTPNKWQTVVVPVLPFDIDIIDIADTVANLFHNLMVGAINALFGGIPQWALDLLFAIVGGVESIIRDLLDIPDDVGEWLLDLISDLGIFQGVLDALYSFIATKMPPVFELEEPFPIPEAVFDELPDFIKPGVSLIPVKISIPFIGIKVDTDELTLNVDLGD